MRKAEQIIILEAVFYTDGENIKYKLKEYKKEYKGIIKISKTGSIKMVRGVDRKDKYIPELKVNSYETWRYLKNNIMIFDCDYDKNKALNVFLENEKLEISNKITFNEVLLDVINKQINE